MAKYYCAWKDNRGVEHTTEAQAIAADKRYEEEDREKQRISEIRRELRKHIKLSSIPINYGYDRYYNDPSMFELQLDSRRNILIDWVIKNEWMLREVLNGTT